MTDDTPARVLGIDPGRDGGAAIVCAEEGLLWSCRWRTRRSGTLGVFIGGGPSVTMASSPVLGEYLRDEADRLGALTVWVEDQHIRRGTGGYALRLAYQAGQLTAAVEAAGLPVAKVQPSRWRRLSEVTYARGDDPKAAALARCEALGWTPDTTDEAEAMLIALAGTMSAS